MPSPSPTTTSAVKLKRRPPLTTLATRLIATTRSRYAVDGAPPRSPRPSPRRSRRPDSPPGPPAPVPRRCVPGITYSSFRCHASEVQPAFAGRVGQRGDAAVVADALALVRLGLADLPDVGGGFPDLLLVDPGDDETCRCLDREADALRRLHGDGVAEPERELEVRALGLHAVTGADDLEGLAV